MNKLPEGYTIKDALKLAPSEETAQERTFRTLYQKYRTNQLLQLKDLTLETMTTDQRKHINYITYLDLYLARMKEIRGGLSDVVPPVNKSNPTRKPLEVSFEYHLKPPYPVVSRFIVNHPDLPELDTTIVTQRHIVEQMESLAAMKYQEYFPDSDSDQGNFLEHICRPLHNWHVRHNYEKATQLAATQLLRDLYADPNVALEVTDDTLFFPTWDYEGMDGRGHPLMRLDDRQHWVMKQDIDKLRTLRLARMSKEDIEEEKEMLKQASQGADSAEALEEDFGLTLVKSTLSEASKMVVKKEDEDQKDEAKEEDQKDEAKEEGQKDETVPINGDAKKTAD